MAEVMVRDGTWTFDGEILRIVPGHGRNVKKLRQLLGEVQVPLAAVAVTAGGDGPDALLRRLRELGDLHRDGALSEEEFTLAKQALLRRFRPAPLIRTAEVTRRTGMRRVTDGPRREGGITGTGGAWRACPRG